MSFNHSLRRTAVGVAATAMLIGGALGFVAVAGTAGAESSAPAVATTLPTNGIALHNNTADASSDCPEGGAAYWHFVLAPNNGSSFVSITLNLGSETVTFTGGQIVKNGSQTDNVFIAVPAGHALTDLVLDGSYAVYSGETPNLFNLSHVCQGVVPTTATPTTEAPTTTSTPTTKAPTTTSTTDDVAVLGTVQTLPDDSVAPEVAGAVQTEGTLPYTGTNTVALVAAGLAILLGGLLLVGLARTKTRTAQQ
jgi:LPXTG-motif cell wall-anchored protein